MANSLIIDGDVDVKNDYSSSGYTYLRYYPYPIDPHVNTKLFTLDQPALVSAARRRPVCTPVPARVLDDTKGASAAMVGVATSCSS